MAVENFEKESIKIIKNFFKGKNVEYDYQKDTRTFEIFLKQNNTLLTSCVISITFQSDAILYSVTPLIDSQRIKEASIDSLVRLFNYLNTITARGKFVLNDRNLSPEFRLYAFYSNSLPKDEEIMDFISDAVTSVCDALKPIMIIVNLHLSYEDAVKHFLNILKSKNIDTESLNPFITDYTENFHPGFLDDNESSDDDDDDDDDNNDYSFNNSNTTKKIKFDLFS